MNFINDIFIINFNSCADLNVVIRETLFCLSELVYNLLIIFEEFKKFLLLLLILKELSDGLIFKFLLKLFNVYPVNSWQLKVLIFVKSHSLIKVLRK